MKKHYLEKHTLFLEENKKKTEEIMYVIFIARFKFAWIKLKKEKKHLFFHRIFYSLKYLCKKKLLQDVLEKKFELRYNTIRNFDLECQRVFQKSRQLRDHSILKCVYIDMFFNDVLIYLFWNKYSCTIPKTLAVLL